MKRQLIWIGLLLLGWLAANLVPALFGWPLLEGFSGLVVQFFFAFCALILVAQVWSALRAVREALGSAGARRKSSVKEVSS